jgi:membrane carboxypeptidase/penicillin-binding protein PbpC
VWVGNFDRKPLRNSSGVTGAAPIFQAVMLAAHARYDSPDDALAMPDESLGAHEICTLSGGAANAWCPARRREWLPRGEIAPCSWHHMAEAGLLVVWPPEFRDWAARNGLAGSRAPHPRLPATGVGRPAQRIRAARMAPAGSQPDDRPLRLVNPPAGSTYLVDPTLRREFQTLQFKVVAAAPTRIEWRINGVPFSAVSSDATVEWPLRVGQHTISARDSVGNTAESTITVR